mmetsp:Transcript_31882/g.80832  ORF Transcript_31882/g.80832 Transcript_31882/m.80832 type:complete len:294 (-) Transcript_31882:192-1073(-)
MPRLARGALMLVVALLAGARGDRETHRRQLELAADDECATAEGTGGCAMNALQLKVRSSKGSGSSALADAAVIADILEAHLLTFGLPAADGEERGVAGADAVVLAQNVSNNASKEPATKTSGAAAYGSCTSAVYHGPSHGAEACFCQKAHNAACVALPCACREGCAGFEYQNAGVISFRNSARTDCSGAMLTIPRAYFADISHLGQCGTGASSLLTSMLMDGFNAYHMSVGSGPVMQCIHKASTASVHWLHLHSFCPDGQVDGLPNKNDAYCSLMTSVGEAGEIARKFLQWSR